MPKQRKVCLIKNCNRTVRSRGLCNCCYQTAWLFIKRGNSTWEQLVNDGFALKSQFGETPQKGSFRTAIESKEEKDKALEAFKKNPHAEAPHKTTPPPEWPMPVLPNEPKGFGPSDGSWPEPGDPDYDPYPEPNNQDSQAPEGCGPPDDSDPNPQDTPKLTKLLPYGTSSPLDSSTTDHLVEETKKNIKELTPHYRAGVSSTPPW